MAVMVADHPPTSLALSDIMHTLSPSSAPQSHDSYNRQGTSAGLSIRRSDTPEPLQDEEIANYRRRAAEMKAQPPATSELSSRELELVNMVMRLTEPTRPSSSQVMYQANLISQLTSQRDHLIQQSEEERARWQSEKEGWARISEALLAQRNRKDHYSTRQEDLERYCNTLLSDNTELRHKEQETLSRLISLENEIHKLKPMLLLQPFSIMPTLSSMGHASSYLSSLPYPAPTGLAAISAQRTKLSRRKKKEKVAPVAFADATEGEDASDNEALVASVNNTAATLSTSGNNGASASAVGPASTLQSISQSKPPWAEGVITRPQESTTSSTIIPTVPHTDSPSNTSHRNAAPTIYQHLLRPSISLQSPPTSLPHTIGNTTRNATSKTSRSGGNGKAGPSTSVPSSPLTSDARSEHLLLAARKIGRERAAIASGLVEAEKEKERDKELQERAKIHKERLAAGITGYYRPSAGGGATNSDGRSKDTHTKIANLSQVTASSKDATAGASTSRAALPSPKTPKRTTAATRMTGVSPGTPDPLHNTTFTPYHPPTPMDSLLSAARSMMDGTDNAQNRQNTGEVVLEDVREIESRKRAGVLEPPVTPTQKRRRVAPSTSAASIASTSGTRNSGARVRSALDVLADQAAAAVNSEKPSARARAKAKGKEKEKETDATLSKSHGQGSTLEEGDFNTTTKSGRKSRATKAAAAARDKRTASSRKSKAASSRTESSTPRMISPADPKGIVVSNSRGSTPRLISAPDPNRMDPSSGRSRPADPDRPNVHESMSAVSNTDDIRMSLAEGTLTLSAAPPDMEEKVMTMAKEGSHPA